MNATSLKIPPELKSRVQNAARNANLSPHAFMVDAIARETERAERGQQFERDADEAERHASDTNRVYDAAEAFAHVLAAIRDEPTERPKARAWHPSA